MPPQTMHPSLSQLIPLELVPSELDGLQEALESAFDDIFLMNLIIW